MTYMPTDASIGDAPKRREDIRFLTGQGAYLDDLRFDNVAHAVLLRSPHAHARMRALDAGAARGMPGVLAVLTAAEAAADGLLPMRPTVDANVQTGEPFAFAVQPLLAHDTVRFVGEPVALVVAATRAQALDAAERVAVEYDPLPAVTTLDAALAAGAPLLSPEIPGNLCFDWRTGDWPAADAAFARAAHVVTLRLHNHRVITNPMEPRGAVGQYDPASGRYTLHVSSQNIHGNRDATARALNVASAAVRFIAPDVGGGFGAKNFTYAEHALVLWAARRVGRPVKWIASRSEGFLSDHQARDHTADAALALDAAGKVPGAAGGQRRQPGRLHGRRFRRGADQPVRASARHHLHRSHHRPARPRDRDQHDADRRDPRPRLRRSQRDHGRPDRRRRPPVRLRSRRPAAPQHGARDGHADDQCPRLQRR